MDYGRALQSALNFQRSKDMMRRVYEQSRAARAANDLRAGREATRARFRADHLMRRNLPPHPHKETR